MTVAELAFGVTVLAAVVYLLLEVLDGRRWWRQRRQPPARRGPRPQRESWPEGAQADAEQSWARMLDDKEEPNRR